MYNVGHMTIEFLSNCKLTLMPLYKQNRRDVSEQISDYSIVVHVT